MARIHRVCFLFLFKFVVTEPFVFTVSNFEKSDDNHVRLSVYFSSVSKIACAANL